jgi:hypothetical protein
MNSQGVGKLLSLPCHYLPFQYISIGNMPPVSHIRKLLGLSMLGGVYGKRFFADSISVSNLTWMTDTITIIMDSGSNDG